MLRLLLILDFVKYFYWILYYSIVEKLKFYIFLKIQLLILFLKNAKLRISYIYRNIFAYSELPVVYSLLSDCVSSK